MGIVLPWSLLMMYQVYSKGILKKQMPEPYYFYWGTLAMIFAAMLTRVDNRLGIAFAWAVLIGAGVANLTANKTTAPLPQNPFKPLTGQTTT